MFPGLHPMAMMSTVGAMGYAPSAAAAAAAAAAVRGTPPGHHGPNPAVAAMGYPGPGPGGPYGAPPGAAVVTPGGVYPPGMVPPSGTQQVSPRPSFLLSFNVFNLK